LHAIKVQTEHIVNKIEVKSMQTLWIQAADRKTNRARTSIVELACSYPQAPSNRSRTRHL